jgi:2-haloacid dehalogenase
MTLTIKALAFDTGGTILDWHSGIYQALQQVAAKHGVSRDWHGITNDYRRLAMKGIVGQEQPAFNMDDVHRTVLDALLQQHDLAMFTAQDRQALFSAWHQLAAWPDFPAALARIRKKLPAISFTMLPLSLVMDVSRKNDLDWDAVISCEMIGSYKPNPCAYNTAAHWMGLAPADILMVACHNFDLNAARACGFKTAFVRRPDEWGPAGPPDPLPHPDCDTVVDDFAALADYVGA